MFKQKHLSLGARFGLAVASFFLGLLLFVAALSTALIANIQIVTSEDTINGMVQEILGAPAHVRPNSAAKTGTSGVRIAANTRTYQMIRRDNPDDVAKDLTEKLIEMFYEALAAEFGDEIAFTVEEFSQMINESTAKDYVAEKTAALITDYFNNEVTTTFEPEEILQIIAENSEMIESITGEPIPDDISQKVAKMFDENEIIVKVETEGLAGFMTMVGTEIPGFDAVMSTVDMLRNILTAVRDTSLLLCIVICLLLIASIILVNCRQLPRGLRRAGYPLMMAGTLVILNVLAQFAPEMWVVDSQPTLNLILKLVRYVLLQTSVVNISVFCLGFALCISGIVLGIVLKHKSKAALPAPTAEVPAETPAVAVEDVEDVAEEPAAEQTAAEDPTPIAE